MWRSYLKLTKPSIMMLVLLTGATALVMQKDLLARPFDFLLVMLALFCTGGSANALNQYFERDIDARMQRTKQKRPLPGGNLAAGNALIFAISIGLLGCAIFWLRFNVLSAFLALATILFYSLFYTLWLKPNTHLNIVIGGAAGSMAPVIAWVAASNSLSFTPWLLFLIIFFWTPPHFWALALCIKEDYEKVGLPMLPLVKGDTQTIRQIFTYTLVMVAISILPVLWEATTVYLVVALLLGVIFIYKALGLLRAPSIARERRLFIYSIFYLLVLFSTLLLDAVFFAEVLPF